MSGKVFKETFNGPYDGVTPAPLLKVGSICDGKNVRKVSPLGGWKPRKGCTLHNSTKLNAGSSILSLHVYEHPRNEDYHFLTQSNGSLYDATNDPPTAGGSSFAASALSSLAGTTTPGFSDMVGEWWLYADGDGAPVMWGGNEPFCTGFIVWDNSESAYVDYTRDVTDNRSGTEAIVLGAADDCYYVCSPCIAYSIKLDLGDTVNSSTSATCTVSSWQSGSWSSRTGDGAWSDGTASSGKTHAQDGTIVWTEQSSDTMKVIGGIMGYWYKVAFSGALGTSIDVISCKVLFNPARITNKWTGVYEQPLSVRFYDQSTGEYVDITGRVTNESTSMYFNIDSATTSDFIYVKSAEPLCGIGFGIVDGYENTADAQITATDGVQHWDGDSWVNNAIAAADDETLDDSNDTSFAASGTVWWNAAGDTVKRRTMPFDSVPGYWYRVSWDAAPTNGDNDVRVYLVSIVPFPKELPAYDGVVEFKGRSFFWGDPERPNQLRFSAYGKPDCLSGSDSGYTDEFGDKSKIVGAIRFHNELMVFKESSVWLLEGYAPMNFGVARMADTVGCVAPKTIAIGEAGQPTVYAHEVLTVAIWMDTDGIYLEDGRKTKKVSGPVDHYFNIEHATAISATNLANCQAFVDKANNEYHLLIPDGTELVYNYVLDEWYPPWDRQVGDADDYLVCGLCLKASDNRYYTYAGNNDGLVFRLETDTTDKNASNTDVTITHNVKTRAIGFQQELSTTLEFDFREIWLEAKARTSPTTKTITTNFFKDMATSGTALSAPSALSLANSGYSMTVDGLQANQTRCRLIQFQFQAATADLELEVWSYSYRINLIAPPRT